MTDFPGKKRTALNNVRWEVLGQIMQNFDMAKNFLKNRNQWKVGMKLKQCLNSSSRHTEDTSNVRKTAYIWEGQKAVTNNNHAS